MNGIGYEAGTSYYIPDGANNLVRTTFYVRALTWAKLFKKKGSFAYIIRVKPKRFNATGKAYDCIESVQVH